MAKPAPKPNKDDPSVKNAKVRSVDLVAAAGARPRAVARLDAAMVRIVTGTAERARRDPGADQTAIREFLMLFAERRNLPVPSSVALDLDAATMAQWPQDLFAKSARLVWERFAEMRVPNPPDFLAFIADDLAARREEIAALHTLQTRLRTIARRGGEQIPADTF